MSDIVVTDKISNKERAAYEEYVRKGNQNVSPSTQAQFLALFLRGKSCEEIQSINTGWPLGAIVKCRIEGNWDTKLEEYREQLFTGVRERLAQIELESVIFLTDMLAAAHKQQGDRIKKYLQTGNEDDLGDMKISSIGAYSKVVELLLKTTGQERQQTIQHNHNISAPAAVNLDSLASATSEQASDLLTKLLEAKK